MPSNYLYPRIDARKSGHLAVGDGHEIYWEESGNPEGKPVIFLHGGPGAGASPEHRRFFDPQAYRIVVFDQRGSGRSRPLAAVQDNSADHLVSDMEQLREMLEIERWQLFGGSWGSTLALAYAITHPERVSEMVLRGIFLGRPEEIDWFLNGMGHFFPEEMARFRETLPREERGALLANYYRRLCDSDPKVHGPAAQAWSRYEAACSTLRPSVETLEVFSQGKRALSLARLEAHYFFRASEAMPQDILGQAEVMADIETTIVQGRYDVICPPKSAYALHKALPKSKLVMVPDAGHAALEKGVCAALVEATEAYKKA